MEKNDPASFADAVRMVREDTGRKPLSPEAIVVLACDELSRTYTYEEKNYE